MLFGACLIVAWKHVQNLKQTKKKESFDEFPTFFLNVLLLNKKEVIKNEVNKKVRKGMFGIGRRIAGSVASRVVSDQKFTQKIAEKIVIGIPPKFKFNDIEATAQLQYVEKNYAVISVKIHSINSLVLIGKQVDGIGKTAFHLGKVSTCETIFNWLGQLGVKKDVEYALSTSLKPIVEKKMVDVMGEQMMKKLQLSAGVDSVVEVKHAKDQPEYFYKFIKMLKDPQAMDNDNDDQSTSKM